jgi:hypothetical protein
MNGEPSAPVTSSESPNSAVKRPISCKIEETFIPAAPRTYLLDYGRQDGVLWVTRQVIIAWQVNCALPEPMTASGMFHSERHAPIILHPDGRIDEVDALWETYDAWLADVEATCPAK